MSEGNGHLVPVVIRDCACPGTPHGEGDVVYLLPTCPTLVGMECQRENSRAVNEALREVIGEGEITDETLDAKAEDIGSVMVELLTMRWSEIFIRKCTRGWNVVDAEGKPVEFDPQVLLDDYSLGSPVADKANDLYYSAVFLPLTQRLAKLSPPGRTGGTRKGISRRTRSTRKRQGRSSRAGSEALTR